MTKQNMLVMTSSAVKTVLYKHKTSIQGGQLWTMKYGGDGCSASANIACRPAVTLALTNLKQQRHCWHDVRQLAR